MAMSVSPELHLIFFKSAFEIFSLEGIFFHNTASIKTKVRASIKNGMLQASASAFSSIMIAAKAGPVMKPMLIARSDAPR